jgi:DNA polymerase-3 subunit gamma/tau
VQPQSDLSIQALLFRIEQLEARLSATQQASAPADAPAPRARETAPAPAAPSSPAAPVTASAPVSAHATASAAPATASAAAVATEPEEEPEPITAPAPAADIDLERVRALWPAVVDEVCKGNQMVGAFLQEARPTALDDGRLTVCFAPGAGFSKKKVESNRQLVQGAVRTLTGAGLDIRYELSELAADDEPAAAAGVLSEEELLERLKQEFGAREVFDDS